MAAVTELSPTATPGKVHTFVAKTAAVVAIDGSPTHELTSQYDAVVIQSDGDNWWILASH